MFTEITFLIITECDILCNMCVNIYDAEFTENPLKDQQ